MISLEDGFSVVSAEKKNIHHYHQRKRSNYRQRRRNFYIVKWCDSICRCMIFVGFDDLSCFLLSCMNSYTEKVYKSFNTVEILSNIDEAIEGIKSYTFI